MAEIIVERSFDQPAVLSEVQALEDAVGWCLEQYSVRFVRTFFSLDRRHMVCFYEAPDAESVRRTQREGKLPFDRIWTGTVFRPKVHSTEDGFENVIVQRTWPEALTGKDIADLFAKAEGCFGLYRAHIEATYLSADGLRTVCHYRAPDAEAVRTGSLRGGFPFERAWASTLHFPG